MSDETPSVPSLQDNLDALDKVFVEGVMELNKAIEAEFEQGSRQASAQLETFSSKVKGIIETYKGMLIEPTDSKVETEEPSGDASARLT